MERLTACPLKSEETTELLLDYAARKLEPLRAAVLEEHIENCADCAMFRDEQSAVWQALDQWVPVAVSSDFNRNLWRKIDEERAAPWYTKAGFRNLVGQMSGAAWKPAFPLAAAVIVVCAGFVLDHATPHVTISTKPPSVSDGSGVSLSEAEQLQRTLDDIQLLKQFDAPGEGETPPRTL